MAQHFMIDLETMSTASDAAIIQIGIQAFDPRGEGLEGEGALIHVDGQACLNAGLRMDWSTVRWWLTQDDDARASLCAAEGLLLSEALRELVAYGQKNGGWSWAHVWGNGAAFDIPILETAFRRCRLDIPWEYNKVLDVRTMKWLAPDDELRVKPEVAHDALSDARAQALWVQNMYRSLRGLLGAPTREEEKQEPPAAAPSTVSEVVEPDKTAELAEFYDRLTFADWWYMMSDDPGVYRRGEAAMSALIREAKADPDKDKLFEAVEEHVKRGGPEVPRPGG